MRMLTEQTFNDRSGTTNKVKALVTIYGSSNDDKPTDNVANGSIFIATDTNAIYMFDEENTTWRAI